MTQRKPYKSRFQNKISLAQNINVRFTENDFQVIYQHAQEVGLSVSDIVRIACKKYVTA